MAPLMDWLTSEECGDSVGWHGMQVETDYTPNATD